MTPTQYWEGNPYLCRDYYLAEEKRIAQKNQEMWLQGLYIYNAFSSVMAQFSYGMNGRKGKVPDGYMAEPIPFTEEEKELSRRRRVERTRQFIKKGGG